jgi:acyl dehydratase
MFYEDIAIGEVTDLGSTIFTHEAIAAYACRFDPRILARAGEDGPLVGSGFHVAGALMRRLVDTRDALRAAIAARGAVLPRLGVSPGFQDMRWPNPVREGDVVTYAMTTVSRRETSKPGWGLVGYSFRGVNQRGETVLAFSSLLLVARRTDGH